MIAYIDRHKDRFGVEPICRMLPIAPFHLLPGQPPTHLGPGRARPPAQGRDRPRPRRAPGCLRRPQGLAPAAPRRDHPGPLHRRAAHGRAGPGGRPPWQAPRWRARPARRGWSRPVALTSSTSGAIGRARTACSSRGPSRRASRVGRQGPAGGPTTGHPGQQAAAVRDRCPGEPSVTGGTSPLDPLEADEAGTDPQYGGSRPVAMPDGVRRSRSLSPIARWAEGPCKARQEVERLAARLVSVG
jgi:hypothetical protein